jgi:hypothetical protein
MITRMMRFFFLNAEAFPQSERSRPAIVHRRWLQLLSLILVLDAAACGYRLSGSVQPPPDGISSLGIPTFTNQTRQFKLEQRITKAVLKEFATRTRIPISSRANGVEAVLVGEIKDLRSSPEAFGTDAFGSAFLVTVQISVKLVRLKDNAVIYENPDYVFREHYVLNSKVTQFFSEENPALERLAHDFAAGLASTILAR